MGTTPSQAHQDEVGEGMPPQSEMTEPGFHDSVLGGEVNEENRKGGRYEYIDLDLLTEQKKRLQVYERKNFPVYYLGWEEEEGDNSSREGNWSAQKPASFNLDLQRVIILHLARVPLAKHWQTAVTGPDVAPRQANPKYLVIRASQHSTCGLLLDFCKDLFAKNYQQISGKMHGINREEQEFSRQIQLATQTNYQLVALTSSQQEEFYCLDFFCTQAHLTLQRLSKKSETHLGPVCYQVDRAESAPGLRPYSVSADSEALLSTGKNSAKRRPAPARNQELPDTRSGITGYDLLKQVGKGGFSRVILARSKASGKLVAMKVMNKQDIITSNKVKQVMLERNILVRLKHPFIVNLEDAFHTKHYLHLVLEFCPAGELFFHLSNRKNFAEEEARVVIAEVILAIEYLHSKEIVYRDLKPENVLVDFNGHIKLTDFGLCKKNFRRQDLSTSLCGSPEYTCPEMLNSGTHSRTLDYYQIGALLYELLTGLPPNYSSNKKQMFANIARKEAPYPPYLSANAKSLLKGLLHKDPTGRLGFAHEFEEIKGHPFFASIDWGKLPLKQKSGPLKPHLSGLYFDKEFVERLTADQLKELHEENGSSTKRRRQRIVKDAERDLKKMMRSARHPLQGKQKLARSKPSVGASPQTASFEPVDRESDDLANRAAGCTNPAAVHPQHADDRTAKPQSGAQPQIELLSPAESPATHHLQPLESLNQQLKPQVASHPARKLLTLAHGELHSKGLASQRLAFAGKLARGCLLSASSSALPQPSSAQHLDLVDGAAMPLHSDQVPEDNEDGQEEDRSHQKKLQASLAFASPFHSNLEVTRYAALSPHLQVAGSRQGASSGAPDSRQAVNGSSQFQTTSRAGSNDGRAGLKIGSGQIAQLGDRDDSNSPLSVESVNSEEREALHREHRPDFKVRDFPSFEDLDREIDGQDEAVRKPRGNSDRKPGDDPGKSEELYSAQRPQAVGHRKAKSQIPPHEMPHAADRQLEFAPGRQANAEDQIVEPAPDDEQGPSQAFTPDSEHFWGSKDGADDRFDEDSQDKQMRELFAGRPMPAGSSQPQRRQSSSRLCAYAQHQPQLRSSCVSVDDGGNGSQDSEDSSYGDDPKQYLFANFNKVQNVDHMSKPSCAQSRQFTPSSSAARQHKLSTRNSRQQPIQLVSLATHTQERETTEEAFQHYNSKSPQGWGKVTAATGAGGTRLSVSAVEESQGSRRNSADQGQAALRLSRLAGNGSDSRNLQQHARTVFVGPASPERAAASMLLCTVENGLDESAAGARGSPQKSAGGAADMVELHDERENTSSLVEEAAVEATLDRGVATTLDRERALGDSVSPNDSATLNAFEPLREAAAEDLLVPGSNHHAMLSKSPQMQPQPKFGPGKQKQQADFGGRSFLQKHQTSSLAATKGQLNSKRKAKAVRTPAAPVHISKSNFNAVMGFVSERRRRDNNEGARQKSDVPQKLASFTGALPVSARAQGDLIFHHHQLSHSVVGPLDGFQKAQVGYGGSACKSAIPLSVTPGQSFHQRRAAKQQAYKALLGSVPTAKLARADASFAFRGSQTARKQPPGSIPPNSFLKSRVATETLTPTRSGLRPAAALAPSSEQKPPQAAPRQQPPTDALSSPVISYKAADAGKSTGKGKLYHNQQRQSKQIKSSQSQAHLYPQTPFGKQPPSIASAHRQPPALSMQSSGTSTHSQHLGHQQHSLRNYPLVKPAAQQPAKHASNSKQMAKIQKFALDARKLARKAGAAGAGDKVREKGRGKNPMVLSHNHTRAGHYASTGGVNNSQQMLFQTMDMRKSQFKDSVHTMQTLVSSTSSLTAQKPSAGAMQRSAQQQQLGTQPAPSQGQPHHPTHGGLLNSSHKTNSSHQETKSHLLTVPGLQMSAHQPRVQSRQLQEMYQGHYSSHSRSMTAVTAENMSAGKTQKNAKNKDELSSMHANRTGQSSMQPPAAGPSPATTKQAAPSTEASHSTAALFRTRSSMQKEQKTHQPQ